MPMSPEKQREWYRRNRDRVLAGQRARRQGPDRAAILARERERQAQLRRAKGARRRVLRSQMSDEQWTEERRRQKREWWRGRTPEQREERRRRARKGRSTPLLTVEERAERARANAKRWRAANPDRAREINRRKEAGRRARKRGGFVETVDPDILLERDAGLCGICGAPVDHSDFHIDHLVPLARGGEHSYRNTQVAHPFCNLSKGAKAA